MPRPLEGMLDFSGETCPVLLVPLSHLLKPLEPRSLSLHFLKTFGFSSTFCHNLLKLLAFLGRCQFSIYKYTVIQDLGLFGTTDNCWTQVTDRYFFFPMCLSIKTIFWLKTRARRWTLTSFNSCWICVKGRMGFVVWVITQSGLTSQSCVGKRLMLSLPT